MWLACASCASSAPVLHPIQPPYPGRVHLVAGGTAVVPFGELEDSERAGRVSGLSPHGRVHVGVVRDVEVRGGWTGDQGTLGARWAPPLDELRKWRASLGLDLAVGLPHEALGPRFGGDVTAGFGRTYTDLFHLWIAATTGSSFAPASDDTGSSALRLHGGLVLGLAVGFRRLHAIVEIGAGVQHERADSARTGLYLVPGFALAARL